jgi:hypothetical protein
MIKDELKLPINSSCAFDSLDIVANPDGSRTYAAIISCNKSVSSLCIDEAIKQGFEHTIYDSTISIPTFFNKNIQYGDDIFWKKIEGENGVDRSYRLINKSRNQILYYQIWN